MTWYPGRSDIKAMVPHCGSMCLLDSVLQWDPEHILCKGALPEQQHPLARHHQLPTTAAIEYAAQATAVHGALLDANNAQKPGVLAKLSDIQLESEWIGHEEHPLNIAVTLLSRSESGCLYTFRVWGSCKPLASGQLMIAFPSLSS